MYIVPPVASSDARITSAVPSVKSRSTLRAVALPRIDIERPATATVYCEGNFGAIDGKTANGLVRHSERYEILSIIDSQKAGLDAGVVLGEEPKSIPIVRDLSEALTHAGDVPDYFILGMAPASGMLSTYERGLVLEAMSFGMNIVNGLHEFLNDDPAFAAASAAMDVTILDVRRPRAKKDLRTFSDRIREVTCPRIAVLGTDCAIGKRTTATILTRALNDIGVKTVLVGTGQTGLMQGARYGVALDAVGWIPFLRAVRARERPEMTLVFTLYRDVSMLSSTIFFSLLLSVAPLGSVFVTIGTILLGCAWLARWLPRGL